MLCALERILLNDPEKHLLKVRRFEVLAHNILGYFFSVDLDAQFAKENKHDSS